MNAACFLDSFLNLSQIYVNQFPLRRRGPGGGSKSYPANDRLSIYHRLAGTPLLFLFISAFLNLGTFPNVFDDLCLLSVCLVRILIFYAFDHLLFRDFEKNLHLSVWVNFDTPLLSPLAEGAFCLIVLQLYARYVSSKSAMNAVCY